MGTTNLISIFIIILSIFTNTGIAEDHQMVEECKLAKEGAAYNTYRSLFKATAALNCNDLLSYIDEPLVIKFEMNLDYKIGPLVHFKSLKSLDTSFSFISDQEIKEQLMKLTSLKKIRTGTFNKHEVYDSAVRQLPALTDVELEFKKFIPNILNYQSYKTIEKISSAWESKLKPDSFFVNYVCSLKKLPFLKSFQFTVGLTKQTFDQIVACLDTLPMLEEVIVLGVKDDSPADYLSSLSSLKKVKSIIIGRKLLGSSIEAPLNFSWLQKLNSLKKLSLSKIEEVEKMSFPPSLRELTLNEAYLKDWAKIGTLVKLRKLHISGIDSFIDDVKFLKRLTKLQYLSMADSYLSDIRPIMFLGNLTYLNLSRNDYIGKIESVRHLTNLQELYLDKFCSIPVCNDLKIKDIDAIKSLRRLKKLSLRGNKIKNTKALKHLKRLEYLNLSDNPLESIEEVYNISGLTHLDISSTKMDSVEGSRLSKNLKSLRMNHIGTQNDIIISGMHQLEHLSMGDANFNSVTLNDLPKLSRYGFGMLGSGKIKKITIENLPNLTVVDLQNGILETVRISNSEHVKEINLSNNNITGRLNLKGLKNLRELRANKNNISSLDGIFPALEELELADNRLTHFSLDAFQTKKMRILKLTNNKISGKLVISNQEDIHGLELNNNLLTELIVKDTKRLMRMNASHNQLAYFALKNAGYRWETRLFELGHNKLKDIKFDIEYGFAKLDLSNNDLSKTKISSIKVYGLNLNQTNLVDLDFLKQLPLVRNFSADNNKITNLEALVGLSELTSFSVKNNPIQKSKCPQDKGPVALKEFCSTLD